MRQDYANKTVKIVSGSYKGNDYKVEGYWKDIAGKSWMHSNGNPACLDYAIRGAKDNLPNDDDVLYGKIGCSGKLIHVSEIE
jgi:hypothetical protein